MEIEWKEIGLRDLPDVAKKILNTCQNRKIFAFYGNLGTGKPTLIKALCRELGAEDELSSPTFAIANVYRGREDIYHLDMYRINKPEEAIEIGIEEYLDGQHYCFIEWPEIIEGMLPPETVKVRIKINTTPDYNRDIFIQCND